MKIKCILVGRGGGSGGGVSSSYTSYVKNIISSDWSKIQNESEKEIYQITIPTSVHHCGTTAVANFYILNDEKTQYIYANGYPLAVGFTITNDITGAIIITTSKRLFGKIVIVGGDSSGSIGAPYALTFNEDTWALKDGYYEITINPSTHNCGTSLIDNVYLYNEANEDYVSYWGYPTNIGFKSSTDVSGVYTLTSNLPFKGKVILIGGLLG